MFSFLRTLFGYIFGYIKKEILHIPKTKAGLPILGLVHNQDLLKKFLISLYCFEDFASEMEINPLIKKDYVRLPGSDEVYIMTKYNVYDDVLECRFYSNPKVISNFRFSTKNGATSANVTAVFWKGQLLSYILGYHRSPKLLDYVRDVFVSNDDFDVMRELTHSLSNIVNAECMRKEMREDTERQEQIQQEISNIYTRNFKLNEKKANNTPSSVVECDEQGKTC